MGHNRGDLELITDQEKKEADFNDWLDSINFVDSEGRVIPLKLEEDDSYDPEGDRDGLGIPDNEIEDEEE